MAGVLDWSHDGKHHEPGFYIGSEDEDGNHLRDATGFPFSVYRRMKNDGGSEICVCHGIQFYDDAVKIANLLNQTYFKEWKGNILV